jgi:hypothetical protein
MPGHANCKINRSGFLQTFLEKSGREELYQNVDGNGGECYLNSDGDHHASINLGAAIN